MLHWGLERIKAKRTWVVPSFTVWGLARWEEVNFLAIERIGSTDTIHYGTIDIGDASQVVLFGNLIDHRGNVLPTSLERPFVIVRPRDEAGAFLVEPESSTGFKIARSSIATEPVVVDLYVIEMGN